MIALGDIMIQDDEVEGVSYKAGVLVLWLRWGLHDLPLLLEASGKLALNWYPEDDPKAGPPVRVMAWWLGGGLLILRLGVEESPKVALDR